MSNQNPENPDAHGRIDDEAESAQESSTSEGPAAEGDYDPTQGSPGSPHPTGESYPEEAARYDDPEHRRPSSE